METVLTRDGSRTLHSIQYDEHYHSLGGAFSEAEQIYFKGCQLDFKAKSQKQIDILDIGFGLGYNVFVAIHKIHEINSKSRVRMVSFEQNQDVFSFLDYPESIRALALRIKKNFKRQDQILTYQDAMLSCVIHLADARRGIKALYRKFDAVFLDPFSTQKNPELWTVDFFKKIRKRMKKDAIAATYSIATPVITGLLEAGLYPMIAQGTATKRYSLVAHRQKQQPLPERFLKKLPLSLEREPFRDPLLTLSREAILKNRERNKQFIIMKGWL